MPVNSTTVSKSTADRHARQIQELLKQDGNSCCADCNQANPRWASWNLGIFICVSCASIHRKLGTHISKVKSVTLDSWTREQVDSMRKMGNQKSNKVYNPAPDRFRPPVDLHSEERDSQMEIYIRKKYQYKTFIKECESPEVPYKESLPRRNSPDRLSDVSSSLSRSTRETSPPRSIPSQRSRSHQSDKIDLAAALAPASTSPVARVTASPVQVRQSPMRAMSAIPPPAQQHALPQRAPTAPISSEASSLWSDLSGLSFASNSSATTPLSQPSSFVSPAFSSSPHPATNGYVNGNSNNNPFLSPSYAPSPMATSYTPSYAPSPQHSFTSVQSMQPMVVQQSAPLQPQYQAMSLQQPISQMPAYQPAAYSQPMASNNPFLQPRQTYGASMPSSNPFYSQMQGQQQYSSQMYSYMG